MVPSFEQWEAAAAAGLDLWRWDNNEYPRRFMARVVAWHELHALIELHKGDAAEQAQAKERRRGASTGGRSGGRSRPRAIRKRH